MTALKIQRIRDRQGLLNTYSCLSKEIKENKNICHTHTCAWVSGIQYAYTRHKTNRKCTKLTNCIAERSRIHKTNVTLECCQLMRN